LRLLDGVNHYIIHQALLFFAAQTTDLHLDSWSVDTTPRGHTHTVWVPLQDLDHRSGVPSVIPWPRGKVVPEVELGLREAGTRDERYARYHQALHDRLKATSPEAVLPLLRVGDFIVLASLTPHFTCQYNHFRPSVCLCRFWSGQPIIDGAISSASPTTGRRSSFKKRPTAFQCGS
jgi:hypothetical protein